MKQGIVIFTLFMLIPVVALASIAGTWNCLLEDGVALVEFIGCTFSPCAPNSGTDTLINGVSQDLWWRVRDGVLEIITMRGEVVATGITNGETIEIILDEDRYLLMKQPITE